MCFARRAAFFRLASLASERRKAGDDVTHSSNA